MGLENFFERNKKAALAFSGGADSSFLLYESLRLGARIKAYFMKTPFQPEFELADARRLAEELGAELEVLRFDILSVPGISENPDDRCLLCKRAMFAALCRRAAEDGFDLVIDGTNASDREDERPGMRALRELGVRSPLREYGLAKEDVRRASREAGLFTWDKPSYSCLATRVAKGERITEERLALIEAAEGALTRMGFSDFRIRVSGDTAKIQVKEPQMEKILERRTEIVSALKEYFGSVMLDLCCR